MTLNKALTGLLVFQIIVLGTLVAMPSENRTQSAIASTPFSHANCQYPDRWTNPPNGCDNSDPAVPECIKAFSTEQGEKDCIAYYVAQHPEPAVTDPVPVQEPTNQCGGK